MTVILWAAKGWGCLPRQKSRTSPEVCPAFARSFIAPKKTGKRLTLVESSNIPSKQLLLLCCSFVCAAWKAEPVLMVRAFLGLCWLPSPTAQQKALGSFLPWYLQPTGVSLPQFLLLLLLLLAYFLLLQLVSAELTQNTRLATHRSR